MFVGHVFCLFPSSRLEANDFSINVLAVPDSDDEDDDVVVLEAEDNSVVADSRSEGIVANLFSVWLKRILSQREELLVDALSYVLGQLFEITLSMLREDDLMKIWQVTSSG